VKKIFYTSLIPFLVFIFTFSSCQKNEQGIGTPISQFITDEAVGQDSLTVNFTNDSKDASDFSWNFGDNTPMSSEKNPIHKFTNTDDRTKHFTVTLIAKNEAGLADTSVKIIVICKKPTASFTVLHDTGESPFVVQFTGTSNNASSYSWNFGDSFTATGTSTPQHTFINNGTVSVNYNVTLTVKNEFGTSSVFSKPITVNMSSAESNTAMGNPSGAVYDIAFPDNYLMVIPQYTISYNNTKHTPNWVSWHLSSTWLGGIDRQNDFRANPDLPAGWYQVGSSEFSGSGFDRGHMCPSADRTFSVADNSATFLMTNMIPQSPDNNENTWADLESYCRSLVSAGNELYIIDGPYGQGGTGSNGFKNTVGNNVVVPSDAWKVIMVLPNGANDLSRVTISTRLIAVKMPNNQNCSTHPWSYYRTSVDAIETLTGYDFFSNVPTNIQNVIEAKVDNVPIN
jgi:DNA/RNA endonuclease G (NUC1)